MCGTMARTRRRGRGPGGTQRGYVSEASATCVVAHEDWGWTAYLGAAAVVGLHDERCHLNFFLGGERLATPFLGPRGGFLTVAVGPVAMGHGGKGALMVRRSVWGSTTTVHDEKSWSGGTCLTTMSDSLTPAGRSWAAYPRALQPETLQHQALLSLPTGFGP